MGYKCSVPSCNGNYANGPRLTVFSFPKEISLRNTWVRIIFGDENHKITINSRVCEKHFTEDDIRVEAQGYDKKSCRIITAKLKKKRLNNGVIPTILPNSPKSKTTKKLTKKRPSQTKSTGLEQCDVVEVTCDSNDVQKKNCDESRVPILPSKPNIIPEFTREECQRLLQCVDAEKKCIFYKGPFAQACQLKKNAWTRVMEAFNEDNVRKRTLKTLKMQFIEMNGLTGSTIDKETNTDNEPKSLQMKEKNDLEEEYYLDCLESEIAAMDDDEGNSRSKSPVTVVDSVAGAVRECSVTGAKQGDTSNVQPVTQADVMRLKTEILQCELETAKLTQSQKKEAATLERIERRMHAKLLFFQLREARLNAWTAEQRATQAGATEDVLQYRQDERAAQNEGNGNHS